jgi:hypothetical protein
MLKKACAKYDAFDGNVLLAFRSKRGRNYAPNSRRNSIEDLLSLYYSDVADKSLRCLLDLHRKNLEIHVNNLDKKINDPFALIYAWRNQSLH